jgi:hypothetical protein
VRRDGRGKLAWGGCWVVDLPKMSGPWRYYVSSDDDAMIVIAIPIPYQRLPEGVGRNRSPGV